MDVLTLQFTYSLLNMSDTTYSEYLVGIKCSCVTVTVLCLHGVGGNDFTYGKQDNISKYIIFRTTCLVILLSHRAYFIDLICTNLCSCIYEYNTT